jgi:hypothetical protein
LEVGKLPVCGKQHAAHVVFCNWIEKLFSNKQADRLRNMYFGIQLIAICSIAITGQN